MSVQHFLNSGSLHINKLYVKFIRSCAEVAYLESCEVGEQTDRLWMTVPGRSDHKDISLCRNALAWWSKQGTFWPSRSWLMLEEIAKRRLSGYHPSCETLGWGLVASPCGGPTETLDHRSINLDKAALFLIYWNCDTNHSLLLSTTVGSNCDKGVVHVHGGGVRKRFTAGPSWTSH